MTDSACIELKQGKINVQTYYITFLQLHTCHTTYYIKFT